MARSLKKAFDATAQGRTLDSSKSLKVVDYHEAPPVLRQQMDAVIAKIDSAPDDYNTVATYGADGVDAITALYKKVERMSQKTLLDNAETLLPKSLEAVAEIDGFLGMNREILRRYNEVHLPDALTQANSGGSANDVKRYRHIEQRRDEFLDHACLLESARALGSVIVKRLESSVEQKELLDLIDQTGFGETLKACKSSAHKPGNKP